MLFTVLLLAPMALPALAAESEETRSDSPSFTSPSRAEEEIAAAQIPRAEDVSRALGEYEREEAERETWLASPEAEKQREQSRLAFAGLSAGESLQLLRSVFGSQLEALNNDPARFLSDAQLIDPLRDEGAIVKSEGEGFLLETTVPVRTEDRTGGQAKVDLSLEATAGGYRTENAISDLRLPDTADRKVEVGTEGVEVGQADARQSTAVRFGELNLLYPDVLPDTDLLAAPTSFGVELYDLLRSEASPETLSFEIAVPAGAQLRSDGRGGAEIVREEERLALIPRPSALDAQGTEVALRSEVRDGSLLVHLAHRDGAYAYPILLDPIVEDWVNQGENWYGGDNWGALTNGAWQWTSNNSNILHDVCCWEGSHAGLLTIVQDAFYGPEQYGQWSYSTGNEYVYITQAWLIPFNRADNGCGSAQPHDYVGLWNPGGNWIPLQTNRAKNYGNASFSGYGKALVLGEGSGPPGVWLACDRVLYSGGVGIWLNDDWGPGITYAGVPSGGWFGDQEEVSIDVDSWDEGLGVQFVNVFEEGKGKVASEHVNNCTGLYGARCPTGRESHFDVSGDSFGEGIRSASVTVSDPTGKTAEKFFTTMVDNSKPEVALEGQLAQATGEEVEFEDPENPAGAGEDKLRLPVYELQIEARDGNLSSDKAKRSGVRDIGVFLDGEEMKVPWEPLASCPQTSCERNLTYTLELSRLDESGAHKLEVKAEDFVGEVKERTIEFEYFPATGIKDEYLMHYFPLPDGQGNEEEEEFPARPELAVNVMNGNLVYRERDIDVEGPAVDLEVERFYNSQLPAAGDSEWGDGWTLAQTPDLTPEEGPDPTEAELLATSGALEQEVELPTEAGEERFDAELQATLIRKPTGGYELRDETGEEATSVSFNEDGRTEARLTEGQAKLDYVYEGGELAGIAVKDPGSAGAPTEPPEEEAPKGAAATPTYSSSFGSEGSGQGQLKQPADLARDGEGNVLVVDKSNNRIQRFSPSGQFISTFGSYGTADGQFNRPASIAIDKEGDIWVADANNNRVQRFDAAGNFLAKFGSSGSGNGQFSGPEGIAIDEEGDLWVADTYNGRVQEFDPEGNFLRAVGSYGSGEGELGEPTGIDIGPEGQVWIADWQNNRVSVFDAEGQFLDSFGSQGSGDGQFNRPDAIDVDEQGNVWVGDQNNDRIQRFDLAGQYVDQFGTTGSGEGQFDFTWPMGLYADEEGRIWVSDTLNHRVQEWVLPDSKELFTAYADAFGSFGSDEGELSAPADVALGAGGDIWVADRGNDRIEHFDAEGGFLSQFGSSGSGNGQLSEPSGIDTDPEGNIWVADTGNDRIQKFSPAGEFLLKSGTAGSGDGQFDEPVGIAYSGLLGGALYVTDRGNSRIQLLGKGGKYWGQAGSYGSGEKQLVEPSAIALGGPSGESNFTLLIADSGNHRIQRWTWDGKFVAEFGTLGSGKGQLNRPEAVEVDEQGTVWVGDRVNDRVEVFDEEGTSLGEFGTQGGGEGQFGLTYPIGIAAADGELLVTDSANNRLQRWFGFMHEAAGEEAPLPEDDPRVEVETPGGLVASVAGEEAGTHTYSHEGDDLLSHEGPQGQTEYEYDAAGRMTKVTLPNGTWGAIAYYADGRVSAVTVDPAGEEPAKTTHFTYKDDSPRRTTVEPPDAPHVVYDIGDDGSVLKWSNEQQPPELDLSGTLYDNREEDGAIWSGDHWLDAEALSEEGIESIEVIAAGDTLVDEIACEQDYEVEGKECTKVIDEWVTETGANVPGHLQIEVIATDTLEQETAERFWVDMPDQPPALAPGTPVPPRFADIARFREEYGLEVVFPVKDEIERNERIFDLIKAWNEPNTPAGQVARASMDRWGVPLRPADVAEMEYRELYIARDGPIIKQWGKSNQSGTYAGYYVDHPAGGLIRVGFASSQQAEFVDQVKGNPDLLAEERLASFTSIPAYPLASLEGLQLSISNFRTSTPSILTKITGNGLDIQSNHVSIGASDTAAVSSSLKEEFGENAPISVYENHRKLEPRSGRYRATEQIRAGDALFSAFIHACDGGGPKECAKTCTASFGAKDSVSKKPNGQFINAHFALTAGHCYEPGETVFRAPNASPTPSQLRPIGKLARSALLYQASGFETDGEALRVNSSGLAPRWIYLSSGGQRFGPARFPDEGKTVCLSGKESNRVSCGPVIGPPEEAYYEDGERGTTGVLWVIPAKVYSVPGDSGAPVWDRYTGDALGLVSGGPPDNFHITTIQPLTAWSGHESIAPGVLGAPGISPMRVLCWRGPC
jgi:YD repeat-containing protein